MPDSTHTTNPVDDCVFCQLDQLADDWKEAAPIIAVFIEELEQEQQASDLARRAELATKGGTVKAHVYTSNGGRRPCAICQQFADSPIHTQPRYKAKDGCMKPQSELTKNARVCSLKLGHTLSCNPVYAGNE